MENAKDGKVKAQLADSAEMELVVEAAKLDADVAAAALTPVPPPVPTRQISSMPHNISKEDPAKQDQPDGARNSVVKTGEDTSVGVNRDGKASLPAPAPTPASTPDASATAESSATALTVATDVPSEESSAAEKPSTSEREEEVPSVTNKAVTSVGGNAGPKADNKESDSQDSAPAVAVHTSPDGDSAAAGGGDEKNLTSMGPAQTSTAAPESEEGSSHGKVLAASDCNSQRPESSSIKPAKAPAITTPECQKSAAVPSSDSAVGQKRSLEHEAVVPEAASKRSRV